MKNKNLSAREAAYLAVLEVLQGGKFLSESLEKWQIGCSPSEVDAALARQIAYGTVRMALTLDYYSKMLSDRPAKKLKTKELALLRLGLYQCLFLDRLPFYAIVNETVSMAKKFCHTSFAAYLNAILRRLSSANIALPSGSGPQELSIRYSYPIWFINELLKNYDLSAAIKILDAGNRAGVLMARYRGAALLPSTAQKVEGCNKTFFLEGKNSRQYSLSTDWYIQNGTSATLMDILAGGMSSAPKTILDLCAAPGGKLLAVHDLYPNAKLYANDVSEKKIGKLKENCKKYGLEVEVTVGLGEEYKSENSFDLIILDVPCSNSAVLNKRPEARWRLCAANFEEQRALQRRIVEHALTLLSEGGAIWYLTCSLLPGENEELTAEICSDFALKKRKETVLLPDSQGLDGGYAVCLTR